MGLRPARTPTSKVSKRYLLSPPDMSSRKLQQEFDKLQKKVVEGLQQFEDIYEKVTITENSNQKEKLEGDLRKEIKKLQRSRDQVKQWLGDSSNKLDKNVLQDNRSRIENAMERFKEVEKVSKMKQFSNEGLEMQAKLGARGLDEAKKNDASKYITEVLDELNRQNELLSGELSQLGHKKKLGAVQQSMDDLTEKIERNNTHIGKLELILRNLENDRLEPDRIDDIKDDLDYYVENNHAADFVEYNEFYDVLELDETLDIQPSYPQAPAEDSSPSPSPKKPSASTGSGNTSNSDRSATPTPGAVSTAPVTAASVVAAKILAPVPAQSPQPTSVRAPPPGLSPLSKPGSPAPQTPVRTVADELKKRVLTQSAATVAVNAPGTPVSTGSTGASTAGSTPNASHVITSQGANSATATARHVGLATPLPILSNENKSFWETAPRLSQLAISRLNNPLPFQAISQMLETSLLNCPDSFDLERPRQYNPINVHPSSVDYPQEPMFELSLANLMKKFDIDTLFFCFYYCEGQDNLAKWNAARELSRRGWVFNKDTKQWFSKDTQKPRSTSIVQREGEGAVASYKYFDYQSSWLIRRKENFTFNQEVRQTF